ncbi:aminotransferase class I/II-fold pyridoxal phosphate-dependent enzyme [Flavobacterium notoginsengisoli]|uniref:aminotransferase class I/II-fold pyridoxal phosphate-dependent enzyme n=1 Tax=Flavobacterium notoginsengisoli TaxID=1478199 RepID=UPI00363511CF
MFQIEEHFLKSLTQRSELDILRRLKSPKKGVDFYSNDYLGLACNSEFQSLLIETLNTEPALIMGATGSRLISGNSEYTMQTEKFITMQHNTEAALLFPSGFMANLALFSSIPQRGDTLLMDEFIHRSVRDGARLSTARCYKFRHNDLQHLEQQLKNASGRIFIAVESLYSMDGDFAPLEDLASLAEQYEAALIVDEAHAFGVFGYGLIAHKKMQNKIFAAVVTYGKAMGLHGAAVLGSQSMIDYLVNYAAPFIYTTALNDWHAISIQKGYEFIAHHPELSQILQQRINQFKNAGFTSTSSTSSPIQTILVPDNSAVKALQKELEEKQLLTFAAVTPTVKPGSERLRICLHAFNTSAEVELLIESLKTSLKT